jgi:hypothetical protein
MRRAGLTLLTTLAATQLAAAGVPALAFDHSHSGWTAVLARRVDLGAVDYAGLRGDRAGLDAYLAALEAVTRDEYDRWSRDQRFAFWINAYNAYTVKLVVQHYPVASIRKIGRLWENPFQIAFIPLEKLRGKSLSLDAIEHDVLRQEFGDARLHAAIVCAARSCPALRPSAYTAAAIDAELETAMREFLADPAKNRWDGATRTLHLSSIFRWFRGDFERDGGSLRGFVAAHVAGPMAKDIATGPEPRIAFLDYDWRLNER